MALYCDFPTAEAVRGKFKASNTVRPGREAVHLAVKLADEETESRSPTCTLTVLCLYSTTSEKLPDDLLAILDTTDIRGATQVVIELWHIQSLLSNPLSNKAVPPQRLLRPGERFPGPKTDLPYMLESDPVAKWLGMKRGQVVVENRVDNRAGLSLYYRLII